MPLIDFFISNAHLLTYSAQTETETETGARRELKMRVSSLRCSSTTRGKQADARPKLIEIPQAWLVMLLASSLALCQLSLLSEAKTHHSKRQAPSYAQTGRENTNWWNLWWQRK